MQKKHRLLLTRARDAMTKNQFQSGIGTLLLWKIRRHF